MINDKKYLQHPDPGSKGKHSQPKARLLKLLGDGKFALGLACLAIAAGAYLISTNSEPQLGPYLVFLLKLVAIISAEFGAVLLSIRYLHLMYEDYLRVEYIHDFEESVRKIIKDELSNTESFQRIGIKAVYEELKTKRVGEFMEGAKKIDVMKTWFPDHPDIENGLINVMIKTNTEVRLLLCHPDSPILMQRSLSAVQQPDHGSRGVKRALLMIYNRALCKFEIGLHEEWPGCPIIWYDEYVLLGFYLCGKSSPYWPWIEIEAESKLGTILREQFDELWKKNTTYKISNHVALGNWLKEQGLLSEEIQSNSTQDKPTPNPASVLSRDEEKI